MVQVSSFFKPITMCVRFYTFCHILTIVCFVCFYVLFGQGVI